MQSSSYQTFLLPYQSNNFYDPLINYLSICNLSILVITSNSNHAMVFKYVQPSFLRTLDLLACNSSNWIFLSKYTLTTAHLVCLKTDRGVSCLHKSLFFIHLTCGCCCHGTCYTLWHWWCQHCHNKGPLLYPLENDFSIKNWSACALQLASKSTLDIVTVTSLYTWIHWSLSLRQKIQLKSQMILQTN